MPRQQFNVSNIQKIDNGKIAAAINRELRQCIDDVEQRPANKTARRVTLTIDLTPILDKTTGALDCVGIGFECNSKVPKSKSVIYPMLVGKGSTLIFNPDSPADPRQMSLSDVQPAPAPGIGGPNDGAPSGGSGGAEKPIVRPGETVDLETGEVNAA